MTWTVRLSRGAARQLRRLPQDQQALIRERLREMRDNPFSGDVIPLKGRRWQGRYRIIVLPNHAEHIVEVSAILLRNEQTYR